MSDQEVVIRISAKNLTSAEFQKAREEIANLTEHAKKSGESLKLTADGMKAALFEAFDHPFAAARILIGDFSKEATGALAELGPAAAGTAIGIAAVAGALAYATSAAVDLGVSINDFAEKASTSVEFAGKLHSTAQVLGVDFDSLGNMINKMSIQMTNSPDKFAEGLHNIGLKMSDIEAMRPEEAFMKIATAFRENTTEMNRSVTAMELFSRSGRDNIPTLMKPLEELMQRAEDVGHVMSKDDVEAAEKLHIAWGKLKEDMSWQITNLGLMVMKFKDIATLQNHTGEDSVIAKLKADAEKAGLAAQTFAADLESVEMGEAGVKTATRELDESFRKHAEETKKAAAEAKKQLDAWNALTASAEDLDDVTKEQVQNFLAEKKTVEDISVAFGISRASVESVKREMEDLTKSMEHYREVGVEAVHAVDAGFKGQPNFLKNMRTDMLVQSGEVTLASRQIGGDMGLVLGDELVLQAKQHMQKLHPSVLDQLKGVAKDTTAGLNDIFQSAFEGGGGIKGAIQSYATSVTSGLLNMIPVVGPVVSQFAGAIVAGFKKLFGGPSQQELQGRDVEKQFQAQFGSFNDMMGAVGKAYEATGRSAQQAQADVKALMDAEKQGGDAAKAAAQKIQDAFNQQKQDQQDLNAAIKEYGFTEDQLGAEMQKQHLSEQAQKLENQFRLLAGSGIDVNLVIQKMGGNLNDFVHMAMKTGQEVPLEMKPIIQKMIELGTLTDENGNKVTDLGSSGIKFSETFSQGIDRLLKGFNEVLEKLGLIPKALANIPKDVDVNIHERHSRDDGGTEPSFADEAYVRRPTVAMIGDVVGGEMVLKPSTIARWLNAAALAGRASNGDEGVAKHIAMMRNDIRGIGGQVSRAVRDGMLQAGR